MNDRLEIASRLLAAHIIIAPNLDDKDLCPSRSQIVNNSLTYADALIKLEQETRQREGKEENGEVLWMTEEPKREQMVFYVYPWKRGEYFKEPWYRSKFNVALFESNQVFDSEDKIRKFLKFD